MNKKDKVYLKILDIFEKENLSINDVKEVLKELLHDINDFEVIKILNIIFKKDV